MKICHVINDLSRGGAESHLYSLVKLQHESGHQVSVMLLGRDLKNFFSLEDDFREIDIRIIRFQGPKKLQGFNPISIIAATKYFSKNKFDIVHSHSPRSDFLTYVSHLFLSKAGKWVVTVHGKYGTYLDGSKVIDIFRKLGIRILSRLWSKTDSIIVISESIKEWMALLNSNLVPEVIPYGINVQKKIEYESLDELRIGFLGRLNPNKGVEDLISVFMSIKNQKDFISMNSKLLIGGVGSDSYERKLKDLANDEDVEFLGYVSDREEFFNSINLFVFTSYSEGLGLALLEAMSYGLVCIARDIDPMNKIITNKENGYLFSDNEDLENIIHLIQVKSNEDIDGVMNSALKTIYNSYSIIHMYSRIEKLYST